MKLSLLLCLACAVMTVQAGHRTVNLKGYHPSDEVSVESSILEPEPEPKPRRTVAFLKSLKRCFCFPRDGQSSDSSRQDAMLRCYDGNTDYSLASGYRGGSLGF